MKNTNILFPVLLLIAATFFLFKPSVLDKERVGINEQSAKERERKIANQYTNLSEQLRQYHSENNRLRDSLQSLNYKVRSERPDMKAKNDVVMQIIDRGEQLPKSDVERRLQNCDSLQVAAQQLSILFNAYDTIIMEYAELTDSLVANYQKQLDTLQVFIAQQQKQLDTIVAENKLQRKQIRRQNRRSQFVKVVNRIGAGVVGIGAAYLLYRRL